MRLPVEPLRSHSRSRLALVLAIPFFAAGCSGESSRFGESAFSNPFRSNSAPETSGSIPAQRPAPAAQVESHPLPQASYQPAPQASYQPPYQPAPYTPPPATAASRASVNTTSHRNAPVPTAQGQVHTVGPGETLTAISRRYGKPLAEVAAANNVQPHHKVRMGDRIVIPGAAGTAAAPQIAPPPRLASAQPTNSARMVTPAAEKPVDETNSAEPSAGAAGFRWPARGRIITGFGPKPTGQQNDGINLALPEGTPVKAAEDGVVAYAGNELKGYGNLVLIRHANGFVTAYAHASEVMVKRGDTIKRGQVIAKSGQTGSVTSPQLHFEIRKGASPVDPMQHLPGAG